MKYFLIVSVFTGALALAYQNILSAPFIFDDVVLIGENLKIRSLWPPWEVLSRTVDTAGYIPRPLVTFTYAINYAISELNTAGYRFTNLLIHLLASIFLFLIIRLTLLRRGSDTFTNFNTHLIAISASLFWLVHPLQTESVTYICQRSQSLMGFFFLLTLYCSIRSFVDRSSKWELGAVSACLLGSLCKSVTAMAPLIIFFYDRLFFFSSYRNMISSRKKLYFGLSLSWFITGLLTGPIILERPRHTFSIDYIWHYFLTQFEIITHYFKLSFLLEEQCLDYGWTLVPSFSDVRYDFFFLSTLILLTLWGYLKKHPLSFLGIWFFLILIPTSSIFPLPDPAFEHYMYLSLASLALFFSLAIRNIIYFLIKNTLIKGIVVSFVFCLAASFLVKKTIERNYDYRDAVSIWTDNVVKRPHHPRPFNLLGSALFDSGRISAAIEAYQKALALKPDYDWPHYNLGIIYEKLGQIDKAIDHYTEAVHFNPRLYQAHNNLALLYLKNNKYEKAKENFRRTIETHGAHESALNNLAWLLATTHPESLKPDPQEAVLLAQRACALTHYQKEQYLSTLAAAYAANSQFAEAEQMMSQAIQTAKTNNNQEILKDFFRMKKLFSNKESLYFRR